MKKYMPAVLLILITITVGIAIAQEKAKSQEPEKAPPPATMSQTGDVVSIDKAKNQIVIKDNTGAEVTLLINASTKITRERKDISLSDVKVGDTIVGECEPSADGCKLKSIAVVLKPPSQ